MAERDRIGRNLDGIFIVGKCSIIRRGQHAVCASSYNKPILIKRPTYVGGDNNHHYGSSCSCDIFE